MFARARNSLTLIKGRYMGAFQEEELTSEEMGSDGGPPKIISGEFSVSSGVSAITLDAGDFDDVHNTSHRFLPNLTPTMEHADDNSDSFAVLPPTLSRFASEGRFEPGDRSHDPFPVQLASTKPMEIPCRQRSGGLTSRQPKRRSWSPRFMQATAASKILKAGVLPPNRPHRRKSAINNEAVTKSVLPPPKPQRRTSQIDVVVEL